jgi:hypothetical protein
VTSSDKMFMTVFIKFRQFVQKGRDRRLGNGYGITMLSFLIKTRKVS